MSRSPRWTIALCLGVALVGCSDSPSSGGGGFEGETIAFDGAVRFGGKQLVGAAVEFQDFQSATAIHRTRTGLDGSFHMDLPIGSKGFLEIRAGDSALARRLFATISSTPATIVANAPIVWTARLKIDGKPVAGATLRILGSTEIVKTGSDGAFSLNRTETSTEWVEIEASAGEPFELPLPAQEDTVLVLPAPRSVLVDDFEGGETRARLGNAIGSGWWFATTDSASDGASAAFPAGITASLLPAYGTSDAFDKTSLSVRFEVDKSRQVHFCQLGVVLAGAGVWMDLSAVDSISFNAKGSGAFRLHFGTRTNMDPTLDPQGMSGSDLTIPSSWTRMVVHRSDITPAPGSRASSQGIPWSIESRQVRTMVFFFTNSGSIQLDDIVFHGPKLADLVPKP
ncbi:MAG: hypothetical protein AAB214_09895 [Fibrobacterota bacterium]